MQVCLEGDVNVGNKTSNNASTAGGSMASDLMQTYCDPLHTHATMTNLPHRTTIVEDLSNKNLIHHIAHPNDSVNGKNNENSQPNHNSLPPNNQVLPQPVQRQTLNSNTIQQVQDIQQHNLQQQNHQKQQQQSLNSQHSQQLQTAQQSQESQHQQKPQSPQQLLFQNFNLHPMIAAQNQQHLHQLLPSTATSGACLVGNPVNLTHGMSTFVTGPSGQQVILGPSAAAALFNRNKQTSTRSVSASSSQQTQQHQQLNGYSFPQAGTVTLGMGFNANANSVTDPMNTSTGVGGPTMMKVLSNTSINDTNQQQFQASNDPSKINDHSISPSPSKESKKRKMNSSADGRQSQPNQNGDSIESSSFEHQQHQRAKTNFSQQKQWIKGCEGEEVSPIASSVLVSAEFSANTNHNVTLGYNQQNSNMVIPSSSHSKTNETASDDKMSAGDRRRQERNLREQARSHKISQQIKALRDVLSESKVPFKANKYSILTSVADYIKQLQNHAVLLDGEHKKLINTIRKTTEMVNSGSVPQVTSNGGEIDESKNSSTNNGVSSDALSDEEMLLVQGLDYRRLFHQCCTALSVVALDGRFLACNIEFQNITGFTKEQLEKKSLFDLLTDRYADPFFEVLNNYFNKRESTVDSKANSFGDGGVWSGIISRPQQSFQINITVTRTTQGIPKFLNCSIFEASSNDSAGKSVLEM